MTTVNYDRAISYYDQTRAYRAGVVERYRRAVLEYVAGVERPRILELAIGTGLIGIPFIAAGDDYIGVDFSRAMMREIGPKCGDAARLDLAQVDISRDLPFADNSFDLAQAVRVFHMLDNWQRCIQEARRVLKPGGHLLIVHNVAPEGSVRPPWAVVHAKWDEILAGLGVGTEGIRHGIFRTDLMMMEYLRSTGAEAQLIDLLSYSEKAVSARMMVERRRQKMFSSDWHLPADLHTRAVDELNRWVETECEAPDEMIAQPMLFRAVVARWDDVNHKKGHGRRAN